MNYPRSEKYLTADLMSKIMGPNCGKQPSRELILHDLHITPPNTSADAKYYVGFYDGDILVAIMDLIDGYADSDCEKTILIQTERYLC